ncbi:hypothetical protein PENTCL1PPCAC_12871, partial [Pristionchus entomophagus]
GRLTLFALQHLFSRFKSDSQKNSSGSMGCYLLKFAPIIAVISSSGIELFHPLQIKYLVCMLFRSCVPKSTHIDVDFTRVESRRL